MYSSAASTPRYFSPGPPAPQATRTAMRSSTATPSDGSRTMTITGTPTESSSASGGPSGSTTSTLKLRGGPRNDQHVAWDEDVIDNEGCGKKSSKICCIYHKPKAFDESSSEESDDSDDSEIDERRRYRRQQRRRHNHHDHHDHGRDEGGAPQLNGDGHSGSVVHELEGRDEDVNAYERAPSAKKGKHKATS